MATPTAGTRTSTETVTPESPTIIPVAGGKGGVGKTLLTANLGLALAGMGCSTVVADLDLGNSNLHSLLGLPNRFPGVGDFLRVGTGTLENFLVETEVPHLRFLPGDGRMPFMANITHAQKMRLLSNLRTVPAQYVILDLGAGCAFHTLDFFSMVDAGMVLTLAGVPGGDERAGVPEEHAAPPDRPQPVARSGTHRGAEPIVRAAGGCAADDGADAGGAGLGGEPGCRESASRTCARGAGHGW